MNCRWPRATSCAQCRRRPVRHVSRPASWPWPAGARWGVAISARPGPPARPAVVPGSACRSHPRHRESPRNSAHGRTRGKPDAERFGHRDGVVAGPGDAADSLAAGSAGLADARPFGTGRCATRGTGFLILFRPWPFEHQATFHLPRGRRSSSAVRPGAPRVALQFDGIFLVARQSLDVTAAGPGATGTRSCAVANDDGHTVVAASKANTREI